ncbi:MAG TPA: uroporphyrinogen-III synthase, partial [Solirubrobacterales bacterium]|nr:uroporphyrinogen-III synthase [Solirubrobacterales bacterium]
LHAYALVCLTSTNGVNLLFEAMATQGRDARALANASVAAIGAGTEAALAAHGVLADIVPDRFVAEELVRELDRLDLRGKPVLIARAAEARELLPDALRKKGAEVDVVTLYETVAEEPDPEALERARDADFITFTSSSTVRNFVEAAGNGLPKGARIVSIGPVTSQAIREAGLAVDVEAERHDIDGLVAALLDAAVSPERTD